MHLTCRSDWTTLSVRDLLSRAQVLHVDMTSAVAYPQYHPLHAEEMFGKLDLGLSRHIISYVGKLIRANKPRHGCSNESELAYCNGNEFEVCISLHTIYVYLNDDIRFCQVWGGFLPRVIWLQL